MNKTHVCLIVLAAGKAILNITIRIRILISASLRSQLEYGLQHIGQRVELADYRHFSENTKILTHNKDTAVD